MKIHHFIGKTGLIGQVIAANLPLIKSGQLADPLERRILFSGPAGVGKTELARTLALMAAGHPLSVEKRMGTEVSVEIVRDWVRSAPYRPMFGDMTIRFIDEMDRITTAITELRGYLDELPPHVMFFATTNLPVKQLPEPLQTRFKVWKFEPVPSATILEFLVRNFPELPEHTLQDIAVKAGGCVRAAETDAKQEMDVLRFRRLDLAVAA